MPYLVDGHNLIPKLGLSLGDPQDELQLVERLQAFGRVNRAQVEVYFDGGQPGQRQTMKLGQVVAHFVRIGRTADSALEQRLSQLGRQARNWQVVSSDARVVNAARAVHARSVTSEQFALLVQQAHQVQQTGQKEDPALSADQLDEWMDLFKGDPRR